MVGSATQCSILKVLPNARYSMFYLPQCVILSLPQRAMLSLPQCAMLSLSQCAILSLLSSPIQSSIRNAARIARPKRRMASSIVSNCHTRTSH